MNLKINENFIHTGLIFLKSRGPIARLINYIKFTKYIYFGIYFRNSVENKIQIILFYSPGILYSTKLIDFDFILSDPLIEEIIVREVLDKKIGDNIRILSLRLLDNTNILQHENILRNLFTNNYTYSFFDEISSVILSIDEHIESPCCLSTGYYHHLSLPNRIDVKYYDLNQIRNAYEKELEKLNTMITEYMPSLLNLINYDQNFYNELSESKNNTLVDIPCTIDNKSISIDLGYYITNSIYMNWQTIVNIFVKIHKSSTIDLVKLQTEFISLKNIYKNSAYLDFFPIKDSEISINKSLNKLSIDNNPISSSKLKEFELYHNANSLSLEIHNNTVNKNSYVIAINTIRNDILEFVDFINECFSKFKIDNTYLSLYIGYITKKLERFIFLLSGISVNSFIYPDILTIHSISVINTPETTVLNGLLELKNELSIPLDQINKGIYPIVNLYLIITGFNKILEFYHMNQLEVPSVENSYNSIVITKHRKMEHTDIAPRTLIDLKLSSGHRYPLPLNGARIENIPTDQLEEILKYLEEQCDSDMFSSLKRDIIKQISRIKRGVYVV